MRYNPRAEPTIDCYQVGRPAYVPRAWLNRLAGDGPSAWKRSWWLGGTVSAVERDDGVIVRSREEWGTREDLERAIGWWQRHGYRAASPGGLLFQAARDWYRRAAWTLQEPLHGGFVGGWEEAQVRGVIAGPHKVLDLRRAYRWALKSEPFPDRWSMRRAVQFLPQLPGLHYVTLDPWKGAPWPARDGGRVLIETPLEITRYGWPTITGWHGGVTWHRWVQTDALADILDELNVAALHRAYWGLWAATTPTTCRFRSGAVTQLAPYAMDIVRAHLIVQRVRRRLADIQTSYRYVDAVIVPSAQVVPTGPNIGDWRVVKEYPDGIHIHWPGHYGPPNAPADKHAGIKRSA